MRGRAFFGKRKPSPAPPSKRNRLEDEARVRRHGGNRIGWRCDSLYGAERFGADVRGGCALGDGDRDGGKGVRIVRIEELRLRDYRNYVSCALAPCEGVTVLLGDNGQGKTNLLEAVYLTCTGRSHRTRQDRDLVRWGAEMADVQIRTQRRDGSHEVEIRLPLAGRRHDRSCPDRRRRARAS